MEKLKYLVVIGDVMLDRYVYGTVNRISPEAPVQVVNVSSVDYKLGGAANVASNIKAMGLNVKLLGIVGTDMYGMMIDDTLRRKGISNGLVRVNKRPTTVKERIVAHGQQMLRIDVEDKTQLDTCMLEAMLGNLTGDLTGPIIISDYDKGVVHPNIIEYVCERVNPNKIKVIVAPKTKRFARKLNQYNCVYAIVINHFEADGISGIKVIDSPSCERALKKIHKSTGCKNVVITRSEDGMSLYDGKSINHIQSQAQEVYDVTGAGDTVIATIALGLSKGKHLLESCVLANRAASLVVAKQGTATVTNEELNQ